MRGGQTIEELAAALELSRTAVRSHLATLQSEGFVGRQGFRRGARRPSVIFVLTSAANSLFPKTYDEFAEMMLQELKRRNPETADITLRSIADRWIARDVPSVKHLTGRERAEAAHKILADQGFMPQLEIRAQEGLLREHNCPLMRLTAAHPELCDAVHRWLQALFGVSMKRVQCQREGAMFSAYTFRLSK
jgi:DeoR family suf operon transcriptional repressor